MGQMFTGPKSMTFPAPNTTMIPVLAREGRIFPAQAPALSTNYSRQNPLQLLIAIDQIKKTAQGELFWDDGEDRNLTKGAWITFDFGLTDGYIQLEINSQMGSEQEIPSLDFLEFFGIDPPNATYVKLNAIDRLKEFPATSVRNCDG